MKFEDLCFNCFASIGSENPCPVCGFDRMRTRPIGENLPLETILQGKYLVGRVLGQGGFGITYLGYDMNLRCRIAIKEFFPVDTVCRKGLLVETREGKNPQMFGAGVESFYQEAAVLARYRSSPDIVSVYDFFRENHTAYFVMEYLQGESFLEVLKKRGGKISYKETFCILTPVMNALQRLHQDGVLHRDAAPDNIFLTTEGVVKLLDFGAAKTDENLSTVLAVKPGYAPVEQYTRSGNQGPWTDVYALASVFYRSLTGTVLSESTKRDNHDLSDDLRTGDPAIPAAACSAIVKALSILPKDRFQSIAVFRAALLGGRNLPEDGKTSGQNDTDEKTVAVFHSGNSVKISPAQSQSSRQRIVFHPERVFSKVNLKQIRNHTGSFLRNFFHLVQKLLRWSNKAVTAFCAFIVRQRKVLKTIVIVILVIFALIAALIWRDKLNLDFDPSMLQSIEMRTNQVTAQNSKEETILIPVETTPDVDIQTRVRPKDEMTEVFVSENGGFWIDQTEVSNEKYQRCVSERSCAKPVSLRSATRDQYYEAVEFANYPVIYLTASQAQAYCQWVGGKLPDQNEWEMAAGGSDGRKYPWGAEFDSGKLNNSGRQLGDTTPVSAYQEGASPYGALNMLGNVSEWISTRMTDETDPQQVYFLIKGGSYQTSDKDISIAFQELGKTSGDFSKIGFRCMRTE